MKSTDTLVKLQPSIDNITEPNAVRVVHVLLNIIESLTSKTNEQEQIIQKQRDEINHLKGEQGKPDIKSNKADDFSSEGERREAEEAGEKHKEGFKLDRSTLGKLEEQRIPGDVLESLDKIKGKRYDSKEDFLQDVEEIIGSKAVEIYGHLLLKYARYKKRKRKRKTPDIKIDRVVKCKVDPEQLPDDAEPKGSKPKIVQDVIIKSDNVLFEREVYWSRSQKKTYLGEVPDGYEGAYGPNINSQIIVFKYVNNMSIPKIKEFYDSIGTAISQSYISTRLTKKLDVFHAEKSALYEASLNVCDWQQIDDTGSRVNGKNHYTHIVCNDLYTAFFTTPKKDRLTILDILRNFESRSYVFNSESFDLLLHLNVSQKLIKKTQEVTELDKELSQKDMDEILAVLFPDPEKGKTSRARITEAAAIASYHSEIGVPAVKVLVSDDAPQFKLVTENQMLCWIHEGRHYKKLRPVVPAHQNKLEAFRKCFWGYYRKLHTYKQNPCSESEKSLSVEFDILFSEKTGYDDLDDRIAKTYSKKKRLLTVLKNPEIPLHNNKSENGARVQKRREDVSLQTKTDEGTKAKDTMMTIVESCKKLKVSAYKFIHDRVSRSFNMPCLAELLEKQAKLKPH